MKEGFTRYLKSKGLNEVEDLRGCALPRLVSHASLSRDFRILPDIEDQTCNACGRCVVACRDGGSNALQVNDGRLTRDDEACSGCGLCIELCSSLNTAVR